MRWLCHGDGGGYGCDERRRQTMTMPEPTYDGHPFDDAMRLRPTGDGRLRGRTTEPYASMVGPFGGVTAAVLLRAIERQPERAGDPVALTVNFVAPVEPGDFEIGPESLAVADGPDLAWPHRYEMRFVEGGYFDQSPQLWGAGGKLLATSQQIVYFKG